MRTRQILSGALLASFIVTGAAAPASAQTTGSTLPVTFDVVGGINISTLSFPLLPAELEELGFDFSIGNRIGFVGGVLIGVPVRDGITFETGGLISYKGASLDFTIPDIPEFPEISGSVTGTISILYLDVPVVGRFRVVRSSTATVSALAGVTMGIRLSAEETVEAFGMSETIEIDNMSNFDLGLTFGGRVEIGRIIIDGRYTFGMLNLAEEEGPEGETIKNRAFTIMGGWRF
jgi:hypothetical protein